jgi:hypothetical protein
MYRDVLAVLVSIHLDNGVQTLLQRIAIGGESNHGEHDLGTLVIWPIASDPK